MERISWRQEHKKLVNQCAIVEGILSFGVTSWLVLRQECFTLMTQLTDHVQNEERLSHSEAARLPGETRHDQVLKELRLLFRYLMVEDPEIYELLRAALGAVLERLQEEVALQEEETVHHFDARAALVT